MFGDNPTGAPAAGAPTDDRSGDTLSGVDALAQANAAADSAQSSAGTTYGPGQAAQDSGFMASPSEPANLPAPAGDTGDDNNAGATQPTPAPAEDDDLLDIKQQALQQLSPLLGHLDQTAEEKFRTTMMMIQATDNQALIKEAYESAQAIEDEKAKAQALLDVVNEINYFTQRHAE